MGKILLYGEPMVMFVAKEEGSLRDVQTFDKMVAGAELNVAIGLRRLGIETVYITRVGRDQFGSYLHDVLTQMDIDARIILDDSYSGFQFKSRTEDNESDVFYFRKNSAASHIGWQDFDDIDFSDISHIHITGIPLALSQSCRDSAFELVKISKNAHISLTFDPNLRPSLWESEEEMIDVVNQVAFSADTFMPGIKEATILTGGLTSPSEIASFYHTRGTKQVVIKMGENGSYYSDEQHQFMTQTVHRNDVKDTVGAGDGFAVGYIYGCKTGKPLEATLRIANTIGGMQLTSYSDNDALPTLSELEKEMGELYVDTIST